MAASIWNPGITLVDINSPVAPVQFPKGNTLNPGITFQGDLDTGIWSSSDGYLNFTVNGITVLVIDPVGNVVANKFASSSEQTLASASVTDIGLVVSNSVAITGSASIASFGAGYKGPVFIRFTGTPILTNSAQLTLPGGSNLQVYAGDTMIVTSKATAGVADGWITVAFTRADGTPVIGGSSGSSSGGGGATGSGSDAIFQENDQLITSSYTIGAKLQGVVTISVTSPCVISQLNTYTANQPVFFSTTGVLPAGLVINTPYYVLAAGLTTTSFQVSATVAGAAIATTGTQSGTHKCGKLKNATLVGPLILTTGATLTIPTGSRLVIL
jgi:hypothetical protein